MSLDYFDVRRLARALRAIHGDEIPLPNRPTPTQWAQIIWHWYYSEEPEPECPTCDDHWAAHIAGLHKKPQP